MIWVHVEQHSVIDLEHCVPFILTQTYAARFWGSDVTLSGRMAASPRSDRSPDSRNWEWLLRK